MRTGRFALRARTSIATVVLAGLVLPATAVGQSTPPAAGNAPAAKAPAKGKAVTAKLGSRVLRKGMEGEDVRQLEQSLARLGLAVPVDTSFDRQTARQVMVFERTEKLGVDGVLRPREARALQAVAIATETGGAVAQPPAPPPPPTPQAPPTPPQSVPGAQGKVTPDGLAQPPATAPDAVKQIIAAGNEIAKTPYRYGGGHNESFKDSAYDCSGSVSYALHGANLLKSPLPSGGFTGWGEAGPGQWVTIYTNAGHMYMTVAGLRFDTSAAKAGGSRWTAEQRPPSGFVVRHPPGL